MMPQTIEQRYVAKRTRILRHARDVFFSMLGLERVSIGCGYGRVEDCGMWALPFARYEALWPVELDTGIQAAVRQFGDVRD